MKALNNHRGSFYGRGSKVPFTGKVPGVPDSHFRLGKNPRPPLNRREKILYPPTPPPLSLFWTREYRFLIILSDQIFQIRIIRTVWKYFE